MAVFPRRIKMKFLAKLLIACGILIYVLTAAFGRKSDKMCINSLDGVDCLEEAKDLNNAGSKYSKAEEMDEVLRSRTDHQQDHDHAISSRFDTLQILLIAKSEILAFCNKHTILFRIIYILICQVYTS